MHISRHFFSHWSDVVGKLFFALLCAAALMLTGLHEFLSASFADTPNPGFFYGGALGLLGLVAYLLVHRPLIEVAATWFHVWLQFGVVPTWRQAARLRLAFCQLKPGGGELQWNAHNELSTIPVEQRIETLLAKADAAEAAKRSDTGLPSPVREILLTIWVATFLWVVYTYLQGRGPAMVVWRALDWLAGIRSGPTAVMFTFVVLMLAELFLLCRLLIWAAAWWSHLRGLGRLRRGRSPQTIPEAVDYLHALGWRQKRSVAKQVEAWAREIEQRGGTPLFDAARVALINIGGLRSTLEGPGRDTVRRGFQIDPTLADLEVCEDLAVILDLPVYPLGVAADGAAVLAVDSRGHIYLVCHGPELLGTTGRAALLSLILGWRLVPAVSESSKR